MKLIQHFKSFLDETVNLNDARIATLNGRVDAITSFLSAHEVFGEYFIDVVPQGSYAQRTIIKPVGGREYDADVLLTMKEHPAWSPAEYTAELKRAFEASTTYKGKAHKRTRCVFVDYADDFHVDVIPFVEGRPAITNNKRDDWETTDPQAFTEWLEGKSRIVGGGRLQAVLRLLKYLRDSKTTFSIKSVILTILVGGVIEAWRSSGDPKYYGDISTALLNITEGLSAYLQSNPTMPAILDPGGTGRDFSERWDQAGYSTFRKQIAYYAGKMREAFDAGTIEDSLSGWQSIFGSDFKAPSTTQTVLASASTPPSEQFIDKSLKIPIRLTQQVFLIGRVRGTGVARPYDLPRRGDRVAKNRTIDFSIRECTVVGPYTVYWKVKNVGPEALAARQLRGQIEEGSDTRYERTSYIGSHFVDVYIVKDGICVATDRQQVVIQPR
jgi:hypothetical protein